MGVQDCVKHPLVALLLRSIRWLPVLFIIGVVCWSYYAYVVELCISTVTHPAEKIAYLIPYHIILFMFLWSYWQTSFATIGEAPKHFQIPSAAYEQMQQSTPSVQREILENVAKNLPVSTRTFDGAVRYCEKCKLVKPDRAHHCSLCGICVLKMDHHCPWVNTCVNYRNYKFFILFLGYALVFCLYVFFTDLRYFIWFWTDGLKKEGSSKFHIMFLFFVSGMFGISVSSLFFYHIWLTSRNRSTLEAFRAPVFRSGPDKDGFNLGCRANFAEVFGDNALLAFVPIFTSRTDGISYPLSPHLLEAGAVTQQPSVSAADVEKRMSNSNSHDTKPSSPNPPFAQPNRQASPPPPRVNERNENYQPKADGSRLGDGVNYPIRTYETDEDGLLHHHERRPRDRWTDEDESATSDYENGDGERRQKNGTAFPLTSIGIRA